jgi:hypothetical protein
VSYQIVPATLAHLRELALTMRAEDRAEIIEVGCVPRHLLVTLWKHTARPMCAIVDGKVAAVWGDKAPLMAEQGSMWLFTSPIIETVPLAFFREAKMDIGERLMMRNVLVADVSASYTKAIRFFGLLGFTFGEPRKIGHGLYCRMQISVADASERLERAA